MPSRSLAAQQRHGRGRSSPDLAEHDRGRGEPERLRDPLRGGASAVGQLARAEQDARELGGEVGLAAALLRLARRARGRPRRPLDASTAATRKTTSATQFSASSIVKRPVGGMWKKLNASALTTLVPTPSAAPQTIATISTPSR